MKVKITQENLNDLKKKGIYRIYCTKSNKSYIGSTWKSFRSRWKQHLYKLNNNNHRSKEMQNAFNKYGTDSFVCEILEIVTDKNILLKREEYYISLYDSYKNGYNENPIPSRSPMYNLNSKIKSSNTHKKMWENIKNSMSKEEFEIYKKEYAKKHKLEKGHTSWNKGIKYTEEQTKNMHKPRIHGVSQAMKEVHKRNSKRFKDNAPYVIVYDINKKWINTFWCNSDLVEYSKSEFNNLPIVINKNGTKFLDASKISNRCTDGKLYKGLYFKRAPKSKKFSYANAGNSWKAESEPIMSLVENTSSKSAETTGEV